MTRVLRISSYPGCDISVSIENTTAGSQETVLGNRPPVGQLTASDKEWIHIVAQVSARLNARGAVDNLGHSGVDADLKAVMGLVASLEDKGRRASS